MPLYDYDCAECGRRVEVIHGVHAPGPTHCPNCGGGPLRKAITAPAVHFKGSGWAKKERHAAVASGARKESDTSSSGDGDSATDDKSKELPAKEGAGNVAATSTPEGSTERTGDRRDRENRPAAPPKPARAATATKTD